MILTIIKCERYVSAGYRKVMYRWAEVFLKIDHNQCRLEMFRGRRHREGDPLFVGTHDLSTRPGRRQLSIILCAQSCQMPAGREVLTVMNSDADDVFVLVLLGTRNLPYCDGHANLLPG